MLIHDRCRQKYLKTGINKSLDAGIVQSARPEYICGNADKGFNHLYSVNFITGKPKTVLKRVGILQLSFMKILKKILFPVLMVATLFTACKKDDDKPSRSSHKVVFKAIGSSGVTLSHGLYGWDQSVTTLSNLTGNTWTSPEVTSPAEAINLNVLINGAGATSAATLKVQIFVDGELKSEGTSAGTVLSASANYRF